jgi:hypothetical protein
VRFQWIWLFSLISVAFVAIDTIAAIKVAGLRIREPPIGSFRLCSSVISSARTEPTTPILKRQRLLREQPENGLSGGGRRWNCLPPSTHLAWCLATSSARCKTVTAQDEQLLLGLCCRFGAKAEGVFSE